MHRKTLPRRALLARICALSVLAMGGTLVATQGDTSTRSDPEAASTATTPDISVREDSGAVSRSAGERELVPQALTDAVTEQRAAAATARTSAEAARESVEEDVAQKKAEEEAARRAAEKEAARKAAEQEAAREAAEEAAAQEEAIEDAVADPQGAARAMLAEHGWGEDQFQCLDNLWIRESNWDHTATNPTSGAYGIPQALPAGKMSSAGEDWETNPVTQIEWGLGYIADRYGTPCSAWAHSESHNWY